MLSEVVLPLGYAADGGTNHAASGAASVCAASSSVSEAGVDHPFVARPAQ